MTDDRWVKATVSNKTNEQTTPKRWANGTNGGAALN